MTYADMEAYRSLYARATPVPRLCSDMGLISTLFTVIVAIPGLIGIDNAVPLATMEQQCYNIESSFKTRLHGPELCG
jgi:hypothetical protein